MIFACGFDHAGISLRDTVFDTLAGEGHETLDLGVAAEDPVDYPDTAATVARAILDGDAERGILVCGSGAGVAVAACKIPGIRAAVMHDTYTAHQAVEHDDVNALCLGARVIGPALAGDILLAYARAAFSQAERHQRRLDKVLALERDGVSAAQR